MRIKIGSVLVLTFLCASAAWAQFEQARWVTSRELIKGASHLDGEAVIFTGEVIGDVMRRGRFVWLNVQDDYGTIGVWAPVDLVKEITYLGDYNHKGDIVAVEGRFSKADYELNGELCLRAVNIRVIFPGLIIFHQLSFLKTKIALIIFILTVLVIVLRIVILKDKK